MSLKPLQPRASVQPRVSESEDCCDVVDLTISDDIANCRGPPIRDLGGQEISFERVVGSTVYGDPYAPEQKQFKIHDLSDKPTEKDNFEIPSQDLFNDLEEAVLKTDGINLHKLVEEESIPLGGVTGEVLTTRHPSFWGKLGELKLQRALLPSSNVQNGKAVYGDRSTCQTLVEKFDQWTPGTGVLMNTNLVIGKFGEYKSGEQFYRSEIAGSGMNGQVYKCFDKASQNEFVLKQIKKEQEQEVYLLNQLNSPFITQLWGFVKAEGTSFMFMENGGMNLVKFLQTEQYTENDILDLTKQSLRALHHLKEKQILYLDAKPENSTVKWNAVTRSWNLKLTDFGAAQYRYQQLTFKSWTAEYMSPEACLTYLREKQVNLPSNISADVGYPTDIWSVGLTMAFLVAKKHLTVGLFTNGQATYNGIINPEQARLNVVLMNATQPNFVVSALMPTFHNHVLKDILEKMLQGDPAKRPTPDEALKQIEEGTKQWAYLQPPDFYSQTMDVQPSADKLTTKMKTMSMRNDRRKSTEPYDSQTRHYRAREEESVCQGNVPNLGALLID